MNAHVRSTRSTGFSLLEVLIAVVVFSFGLLALASLQGAVFKSSAEAKAQSVALGLATEKLEYFRGFRTLTEYQAANSGSDAAAINVGGVSYTRNWTVTRYAYPTAGGNFASVTVTGDLPAGYVLNNEFKRILVNVIWTDAQGANQRVSLEEAMAALDPADSGKVGKLAGVTRPRGPEIRIFNPAKQQEGVIPIAIGSGSDDTATAATNPKPLVNGSNVIETRFDVLTYGGLSRDTDGRYTAVAQARVETAVVGCSCDYGNKVAGGMRPTYWDGTRYTIPETAASVISSYGPIAGPDTSAAAQSKLCTLCCRDHHDPTTLAADAAKFDPRNSGHSSGHFKLNAGVLSAQALSGKYTESCRVIRVGGLYRVAADTYDDYQNFLATRNIPKVLPADPPPYLPTSGLPDEASLARPNATKDYQDFVSSYLTARVVTPTTEPLWNNVLPITAPLTVSGLETTYSVYATQPAVITFRASDPPKWLHLRGLYVDYLEKKALQAIKDAKDGCLPAVVGGAVTAADLRSCVLKVLPFTSINLTELGIYSPLSGNQIVVANNNFYETLLSTAPVRGKVVLGSNPTNGLETNALAKMRYSNSGLTTLINGIDTDDVATTTPQTWTATQKYAPSGIVGGGAGGQFYVNLMGYPFSDNVSTPSVNDAGGATCNYLSSAPNNFVCTTATLGVARTLTFGRYNFSQPLTQTGLALSCTDGEGANPIAHTFSSSESINICRNFQTSASDNSGVPGSPSPSDGGLLEQTPVNYMSIANAAVINVTLTEQTNSSNPANAYGTGYICTYTTGTTPAVDADFSVSPASCAP